MVPPSTAHLPVAETAPKRPDRAYRTRHERVHQLKVIETGTGSADGTPHASDLTIRAGFRARLHSLVPCVCVLAAWGVLIAAGFVVLEVYAAAPGARGRSLPDWPQDCMIPIDGRHPTLLIFLHPLCPCSSASVDELTEIVGRCGDRVKLHAVLLHTISLEKEGASVVERSLVDVPGMTIWPDEKGALARGFGVLTSVALLPHTIPQAILTFSGGITASRITIENENFGKIGALAAIPEAIKRSRNSVLRSSVVRSRSRFRARTWREVSPMTSSAHPDPDLSDSTARRAQEIYQEQLRTGYERVDQLFAVLLVLEWSAAVSFAILVTPYTWAGETRWVHLHVWSAILLGGAIVCFPVGLTMLRPAEAIARHAVAISQAYARRAC